MCSCAVWSMAHRMFLLFLLGDRTCPLVSIFQILMQFVSTRIFHHFFSYSFLYSYFFSRYLSAGRHAPLRGADGKADRRKVPAIIRRGAQAGVTEGRWSGWRLAAIVEAFTFRRAFFAWGRKNKTIHIKHNHALCTRLA